MPEIATLAGLERLDMMLNDSMYGILFRDINPVRTFVDQRFSRQVHARAGIVINTGEDNYLTTADAVDAAHTVTVSQLLNEYFAKEAGLNDGRSASATRSRSTPSCRSRSGSSWPTRCWRARCSREAPLKWMPPTKHMTGDVFRGYLLDGFFNLVGALTGQGILLVGMMTEAVVTPLLSATATWRCRTSATCSTPPAGWPRTSARRPAGSSSAGRSRCSARRSSCSSGSSTTGLLTAIGDGTFGLMKRPADRGKGLDGVVAKRRPATSTRRSTCSSRRGDPMSGDAVPAVVRPYGDTTGDGMVQVSFTLPVPHGTRAPRAPRSQLARKMGIDPAMVVHAKAIGPGLHLLRRLRAGAATSSTSPTCTVAERDYPLLTPRRSTPPSSGGCGASSSSSARCIGTDAHTVGIDAILNIKGFAGEKGLEYYRELRVVNLGAQVLVPRARRAARGPSGPTPSWSPRSSPSGTRTCTTPGRCRPRSARRTPPGRCRCSSSAGPGSTRARPRTLGVDRVFGRGTTPGEVASLPRARRRGRARMRHERPTRGRD